MARHMVALTPTVFIEVESGHEAYSPFWYEDYRPVAKEAVRRLREVQQELFARGAILQADGTVTVTAVPDGAVAPCATCGKYFARAETIPGPPGIKLGTCDETGRYCDQCREMTNLDRPA